MGFPSSGEALPETGALTTGVAVNEVAFPLASSLEGGGDTASSGTGLRKKSRKKFLQGAFDGMKCPPSWATTRRFADTSIKVWLRSAGTMTSFNPITWRVGVLKEGSKKVENKVSLGLNPEAEIQNELAVL